MADLATELAKKPPAVKLGILLAVVGLLGVVYWQMFYSSMSEELEAAKQAHASLQQENTWVKAQLDEWEDLIRKKDELYKKLENNKISLPQASELPAFYAHLQKQAAASGVTIRTWKRAGETPVETYVRVPVDIEVAGTFYQINKYFHLLFQTERIISVEDLTLKSPVGKGEEIVLTAKFTSATYRQADRPKSATPTPAAEQPAGIKPENTGQGAGQAPGKSRLGKIKDNAKEKVEDANANKEKDADEAAGVEGAKPAAEKAGTGQ